MGIAIVACLFCISRLLEMPRTWPEPQKCGDAVANQASAGNNFDQAGTELCVSVCV